MVSMCVVSLVGQFLLTAITPELVRLCSSECKAEEGSESWKFETNPTLEADRICSTKYGTCIGIAHDRKVQSYETLVLMPPNDTNVFHWVYHKKNKIIQLHNHTHVYWDIQNDQKVDNGPIQLLHNTKPEDSSQFTIESC